MTTIIGRVAVKVYPMTKGFGRELERQLKSEERDLKFEIPTKLDMRGAMADFRKALVNLNRENRTVDGRKLKLYAMIDPSNFDQLIRGANRDLERLSKADPVELKVKLGTQTLKDRIEVNIKPVVTDEDLRDLKKRIQDKLNGTEINLNLGLQQATYRKTQAQLARLGRTRPVRFLPFVDGKGAATVATALAALSGARLAGKVLSDIGDALKNIDKDLPKVAAIGSAIFGLAAYALSASANLFALSASLAQIALAGFALPGIFGGMAIGLGITIMGLKDMNKVMPDVISQWKGIQQTVSTNFWAKAEAPIRRMTDVLMPQLTKGFEHASTQVGAFFGAFASDMADQLQGSLVPMFKDLGDSVTIATTGTKDFARIIRILGQQGAGRLPQLAGWFVKISKRFSNFLDQADKSGALKQWIDDGISALKDLGKVTYQTGRILGSLARAAKRAGGTSLATLGDKLQNIADVVGGQVFQQHLTAVFVAAGEAMDNLADIAGPKVEKMFLELSETVQRVFPQLGTTIGTAFGAIADALARPVFNRGIIDFFDGLSKAVDTLAPVMPTLGDAVGKLGSALGTALKAFSPALAGIIKTIADLFISLAPAIEELVKVLGGAFSKAVDILRPALKELGDTLGPVARDFAKELGPALGDFLDAVKPLIEPLGKLVGHIAELALKLGTEQLKRAPGAFKWMGDNLVPIIKDAITWTDKLVLKLDEMYGPNSPFAQRSEQRAAGLKQFGGWLWDQILLGFNLGQSTNGLKLADITFFKQNSQEFHDIGVSLSNFLSGGFLEGWEGLIPLAIRKWKEGWAENKPVVEEIGRDIWRGLVKGVQGNGDDARAQFASVRDAVVNAFKWLFGIHSPSTVMIPIGADIVRGLYKGITDMAGRARDAAVRVATAIKNVFTGAGGWLVARGRAFVQGLISGVNALRGAASSAAQSVGRAIRDKFTDAGSWLINRGSAFVRGLASGINGARGRASDAARSLRESVRNVFANAGSMLIGSGSNIAAGLAAGIRRGVGWVTNAARSIANAAANAARRALDEHSPSRVFHGIGEYVGIGLAEGIEASTGAVKKSMTKLSNTVADTTFKAPGVEMGGVQAARLQRVVSASLEVSGSVESGGTAAGGPAIHITNINPVRENTSTSLNKALQVAAVIGA